MTDEIIRKSVIFSPRNTIECGEDFYRAIDGWRIEYINEEWTFCASDPGLSAKDIRVRLIRGDFEYAKKNNPTFNEMLDYMKSKGRI
ncbi:hypothetical protein [Cellvibrio mixtus]|uniref:hypothetical protein n=1 Tax=Cellvibrio mixtus TaxID=39650 RepID=UPI001269BA69|nr:hypothetical protein [Cellvibrio mixtus]